MVTMADEIVPRRGRRPLRWLSTAASGLGLLLAIALIWRVGPAAIAQLVWRTRWWLPLIIVLHTPQTLCSALGWRALLDPVERPSAPSFYLFRWIRESVNSLLPVAQVGGEVVRARLLGQRTGALARAGASCALDVTLELAAQVVFTLMGIGLLAAASPRSPALRLAGAAVFALALLVAGLAAVQRLFRSARLQALVARQTRRWAGVMAGPGVTAFRPDAGRQLRGFLWHLLSWLLGAVETWAGLRALGLHLGPRAAAVIESLGQVVRAAAFAVPGAVGVQEGGLVLVCGLFGVVPAAAVALSLLRRVREVVLGAPGLVAWRQVERARVDGGR